MASRLPANTQLSEIKGITPALQGRLSKLGIFNLQGLLLHLPLRYLDETRITPIRELRTGEQAQVQGEIVHAEVQYRPRKALVCRLKDDTGQLVLRFLHFYPSQVASLKEGRHIRAFGEVRGGFFGWEMVHPQCRQAEEDTPVADTLTPLYSTTAGLSQTTLRKWIAWALQHADMAEILPQGIYQTLSLPSFADSLQQLHHPAPGIDLASIEAHDHPAWRRLAFDELLAQQLSMRKHHERRRHQGAPALAPSRKLVTALLRSLPFALTQAQQRVALEIGQDLQQSHPMQRLLQGDVGSGKTIVAAMAALQAIENGWQAAIMAPTEILAEQHYWKMQGWLAPLGIRVAWLSGSQGKKERREMLHVVENGEAQLVIGTHALFQDQVVFQRLALAIIDEQHRFGVQQRLSLRQKGGQPHQLMMSATPIPRTLSMSYFADLDVSVIDELPPGRTPITTRMVSDARRGEVLERVQQACMAGRQAYWVCPLIEESEALQLQTVMETYEGLRETFPQLRVGLVHGRMKPAEKQQVMAAFSAGETQLLVATTVIEVGVDVPNASLMVIEHAERMGLAQLHQLRGRVGRGAEKSSCILLYQDGKLSETARARLKIIYESRDGFAIAQADLALRGPGEFMGIRQSGVPMLKIADLERDQDLLATARDIATDLLLREPQMAEAHLARWLGHAEELVKV
ncbi:ATP-dependent DNA helicase RecG [Methylobacillus sp.]|uniref:ATP-dependent DNA helicase RecG n=1 Tax=Methylobacillus sp. TaxID=56818 RepID=UPI002FE1B5C2